MKLKKQNSDAEVVKDKVVEKFSEILSSLGVDLGHPDFKETPKRLARLYREIFDPGEKPQVTLFPNTSGEGELVVIKDINVVLFCPHHLLPVELTVHVGYVTGKCIPGLSKVPRLAKYVSRPPKTQESYTEELVEMIMKEVQPRGCMVIAEGRHTCMRCRGVKQKNNVVITSAIRGVFSKPPKGKDPRSEMLELLKLSRNS